MGDISKLLGRLPIVPAALVYCAFLAYSYNDWLNSNDSELGMRKVALVNVNQEIEGIKKKVAAGEEFFRNLDAIRERIRTLTAQLDNSKSVLNADIDIANFVRMVTLEAKKLGLVIKGIRPEADTKKDYYIEVPFTVNFRGAYIQALVFFDRIAKLQQVIRISAFTVKPSGNAFTKYVELDGSVKLVSYKYLGTQVDEIMNAEDMKGNEQKKLNQPDPTVAPAPQKTGDGK